MGVGGMKMDNIILDLSDPANAKDGRIWLDLDKELGIENARSHPNITGKLGTWLLKPENSIKAMAALLGYDKNRKENVTNAELAGKYVKGIYGDKLSVSRGEFAMELGRHWLNNPSREQVKEAVRAALKEFL